MIGCECKFVCSILRQMVLVELLAARHVISLQVMTQLMAIG